MRQPNPERWPAKTLERLWAVMYGLVAWLVQSSRSHSLFIVSYFRTHKDGTTRTGQVELAYRP